MSRRHWEQQASNWAAWARAATFDEYWKYSAAFFELLPKPAGLTIEVGCGEGRVTRDLIRRGHKVVSVDLTAALVKLARDSDGRAAYLRCDAAALPFASETFNLAVFYNSLMDIDGMQQSVLEAARVLRPGGRLCACVTHPIPDAGRFVSAEPDASFIIEGSYLGSRRWLELEAERDGLPMNFSGWAYPLETYFRALENAGLMVDALREPPYPEDQPAEADASARWRRIPMFLMWRAVKP